MDSLLTAISTRWEANATLAVAGTPWLEVVPDNVVRELDRNNTDYAVYRVIDGSRPNRYFNSTDLEHSTLIEFKVFSSSQANAADYERAIIQAFDDASFALTDGRCQWMKRMQSMHSFVGTNGRGIDIYMTVATYEVQYTVNKPITP